MTQHSITHTFINGTCDVCEKHCPNCNACECIIHADELLVMANMGVDDSWYEEM